MADLRRVCIEGFCSDVPEYTAGQNITITNENVINAIVDLSNYYNKAEVNNLIDGLTNARIEVVQELPQTGETNVIYLVPKDGEQESNVYDEYVYASNAWEKIGGTEIDLSDYVTTEQMDNALATKQNKLTAGANVQINGNTISATDTKYTAGTNITINGNTISANSDDYTLSKAALSPSVVLNKNGNAKSTVTEDILLPYAIGLPRITHSQTEVGIDGGETFWKAWLQYAVKNYKTRLTQEKQILAVAQPNSMAIVRGYVYPLDNSNWSSNDNLPQYSLFTAQLFGAGDASKHIEFGTNNYVFYFRYTDSNSIVSPATATPLMDGTEAVGTSVLYARQDHRHPTDTTRAPLASPALTGTPTAPTAAATTNNTQIATTAMVQAAINRRLPKSTNVSYSNTTAVSVANNTDVSWDLWTAPAAGIIIAHVQVRFVANATGRRRLDIEIDGSGTGSGIQVMASPSGTTGLDSTLIRHINAGSKVQMLVAHSAGAALNVDRRYMFGIFIAD